MKTAAWGGVAVVAGVLVVACGRTKSSPEPVPSPPGPTCAPTTCAARGATCGTLADGCGGTLTCGDCPGGQTCGGGGTPNVCGQGTCAPRTCAALGKNCGAVSDGCGATLDCGGCATGQTCGGGGTPNVCGQGPCTPKTCAQLGANCGSVPDGCGATLDCGTCGAGQTCGGGGTANVCGASAPQACAGLTPPSPGAPMSFVTQVQSESCAAGTSDGNGRLLLVTTPDSQRAAFGHFVTPAGQLAGTHTVPYAPLPQVDTFEGIEQISAEAWLSAYDENGQQIARTNEAHAPFPWWAANDPLGGLVVVAADSAGAPELLAYDARLTLRWSRPLGGSRVFGLGVDRSGQTLILFDGSAQFGGTALAGQWFDHTGVPGALFKAWDTTTAALELFPQVGSGLFLRAAPSWPNWIWVRAFASGALEGTPPPSWLTARPGTRALMGYGAQAYLMLPDPTTAEGDCSQSIEVVAADGTSCGSARFAMSSQACQPMFIQVGYDGTVIQTLPNKFVACAANGRPCSCQWHYWPAFFGQRR